MSLTEAGNEFSEIDLRDDISINGALSGGSSEEANRICMAQTDTGMLPSGKDVRHVVKPQTLGLNDPIRTGESAEETFARLEREVVEGEISERDLVNSVLYLLVGGQFDMENSFILREGHHVRLMINLLDKCPSHLQAEVLSVFIGIARRSNRNLEKCLENDLIRILLERLPDASDIVADLLIELLTVLTTYSINVKDMNAVLRYLRASNKRWPCHSVKLLVVVKQMMRKDGPDIFFSLSGHPNSGIHIPPLSRWPYQNGWSFVTWLRLDPETSGSFEEDMPYLFSYAFKDLTFFFRRFRTRSGFGHSCHFVGSCMVLTTNKSKGGQALQQCIKYEFQLRRWYHVALAYSFSRWGRSEVHCYINGQRTGALDFNWHVNTSEQYDRCFVGCSPDTNVRNSFSGQLSALYLFSETLTLQQVNSLFYLGPNYQSSFKFKNEVDIPSAYLKYLFDGKLANSLVFAYCPKNCDRQLCLNSVNKENQLHFRQTTHAVMMDGVRVVVTHSIYTSLHSVGGIQILLPLLSQLDLPVQRSDGSSGMDYLISSILLSIFSQLLQSSPDVQLQMLQSNAFLVIGVALTAADKAHMTESVLNTLIDTAQFLMVPSATNLGLLRQLFDYVLLNPDLWINTDGKLQTRLYGYLATDFFDGAKILNPMRRVTTVMQLLHALKFYYWVIDPLSRSGIEAKGKGGPRPSVEQIVAIRTYILTLLFKIVVKDEPNAQTADEVEAILNFLTTVHEDDNLTDVLQTLIRLMAENPATLVPTFDKKKGVWVVFKLIGADGEMVRLLALKLLGFFLCRCTAKRKQDAMTPHNLYTLLVDRLLLHATYLNIRTYNVLFELLTESMTIDILDGRHKEPDTSCTFENPMIIKAIASLLHQSKENEEVLEVKRVFLTDLISMCSSSKENRRSILQMSVWQDWLISLTSLRPKSPADQSILKLVYQLFSTLLHHAIRLEFGGWRVWIDTMAIIHSKASFENFCLGSSKAASRSQSTIMSSATTVEQEVYHLLQDVVRKVASTVEPDDHQVYKIDQSSDMLDSAAMSQRFGANPPAGLAVPLYRIPEFRWSPAHLTLLSDLLLSIETDIAAWKNDGSRTLIDFINQSENAVFVVNSVHVVSQSLDNFIVACGGLLPLLAALTSPNTDLDIVDTTSQGLPVKVAISFLIRLANLADVIVFGTACNFADLEHEKNMPNGGIMRQILRLVTTVAVRNCLVSHYRTCFDGDDLVVSVKERAIKVLVDDLASVEDVGSDFLNLRSSIQDPERVLQEVDVYRLKAAVYRDIEESRQCQFLALATVYFISVLMVSRYRDILEPPSSPSPFHNTGMAGSNWDQVDKRSEKSVSIGEQSTHESTAETKAEVNGEDARESARSVDTFDDLTDSISMAAESTAHKGDKSEERSTENHAAQDKVTERKNSFNRERQALLTARLRNALDPVAPLLREIIGDFQSYFQKTLLGTHGQEIMNDHKVLNTLRNPSVSVVELVMLLCSQEWQTSLQKHAGLAFIELVNEGRLLAHATRDHLVRVANEAEYILNRIRAEDVVKHAEFEALCAQAVVTCKEEENTCNLLLSAARRRNVIISRRILQKIVNILNSDYGAWGGLDKNRQYWTLDLWEDDSRRRKRLIPNPYGSSHPEATLKAIVCHGMDEKEVEEARDALASYLSGKNIALPSLMPSSASDELVTESEVSLWNDDKEAEQQQHGASCLITPCHLIAPGLALPGILSVTANEVAFDAKEDEPEFKRADPQVVRYCEHLHGRWHTGEIRAIFLRCYLLQYRALELFMSSRTAVMFAFADQNAVKQVVKQLPPVGVGVKYGIGQNRKASLMTPRQLFKQSDMPQKWQKREISNFDYLMFLNTIAGRTYNDLNQYPVFPWILSNYESRELDLKQPANFRDLSKPVGALNDSRRKSFIDRYNQWEHEKIPPFHYGTHYSTAAFTLNWMIRMEPFTTLFLNLQGGKFDHADRMFHSIGESWNRCLRDTHDVKELIPEFFYLPEILLNINGYNLGKRDDGTIMGDVKLPPWAKSAEHFISIHRQALESDLVSCQLHQWIDLIFGYKQRGPEAVRATNVFYYLTYEGVVDLSVFDDPTVKQALENQIRHFGQTPAQLLFEPHTPRQSIMTISPLMFKPIVEDLCMIMKFISNSPVVHLSANTYSQLQNPTVVSVTASLCFALNRWNNNFTSNVGSHLSPPGTESAAQNVPVNLPLTVDPLLAAGNPASPVARRVLGDSLDQHMSVKWSNFVTTADSKYMFVCGYPDHSFRLLETDSARVRQVLYGHKAVVTCLARSESGLSSDCFVASGSRDCTVLLWHWNAKQGLLVGEHAASAESVSPKAILIGHDGEISCIHVSAEHGLVISASVGGALLIHTTQGDLLRCLRPAGLDFESPRILLMSRECFIVVCYDEGNLCLFTTSGRLIKHVVTDSNITCMCLSRDGEYFVVGTQEGTVFVYSVLELTCLHQYCACDSAVKSIALVHNHRFILAGLATGAIVVYNVDFNRWHHEYSQRYTKATLN